MGGRSGRVIGARAIATRAARNAIERPKCRHPGSGYASATGFLFCAAAGGRDIATRVASSASKFRRPASGCAVGMAGQSSPAPGKMAATVPAAAFVTTAVRVMRKPRRATTSAGGKAEIKPEGKKGSRLRGSPTATEARTRTANCLRQSQHTLFRRWRIPWARHTPRRRFGSATAACRTPPPGR